MKILLIDDERNINRLLTLVLETDGHEVVSAESGAGALRQMQKSVFDIAFLDLRLGSEDGLEVLLQLRRTDPTMRVVLTTAYASIPTAVEAMRRGAADYLPKPFTPEEVRLVVERLTRTMHLEWRVEELESMPETRSLESQVSSKDAVMQKVLDVASKVAVSHASILLLGESGTGKTMLARAIHRRSLRAERPFITVSCPSLSRELLESDLFGHAKGAFTGAVSEKQGKVAVATGGTLYLDEVGEVPPEIQAKLLRLLQEREYERVGETVTRRADVRVIASTNRDLAEAISLGQFREDLLYRLNVVTLELPPLRERPLDFQMLAETHLAYFARQTGKSIRGFSPQSLDAMRQYAWPGNLRELRNVIERAVILCDQAEIEIDALPTTVRAPMSTAMEIGGPITLAELCDEHTRRVIEKSARMEDAAKTLGVDPATLYRRRRRRDDAAVG
jgi:two-component system, NtrC family, response regulator AlgB